MIVSARDRMCPLGLEKREIGSFRKLTWLYIQYMLSRGGSPVRCEEMDWGQDVPD